MGFVIRPLLQLLSWAYAALPPPLQRLCGRSLGALLRSMRVRAAVVEQNLAIAYPGAANQAERARLFRESYAHLGSLCWEVLMLFGPLPRFVKARATITGAENWRAAMTQGRGVILLSSHVGNWEIMSASGGTQLGMELMLVTKRLKPAWLHEAIERGRARGHVSATYEPRTLRDVLAHLKAGREVGMVLDQYAGAPVGVRVPVFGVPVGTMTAAAAIAKRTGAAVLPVVNYREPNGHYRVEIRAPLPWIHHDDPNVELAENTAQYARVLEGDIRAHPEQWLWIHRRFKGDLGPLREGEWAQGRARK